MEQLNLILSNVSKNCLRGYPVPFLLGKLWEEFQEKEFFIKGASFGEINLIDSIETSLFEGYTEDFCGDLALANAYQTMFQEILFFGKESDGGLLGFWYNEKPENLEKTTVLYLTNEGQFIAFPGIADFLFWRASIFQDEESIQKLIQWLKRHGIVYRKTFEQIISDIKELPNPEEKLNKIWDEEAFKLSGMN